LHPHFIVQVGQHLAKRYKEGNGEGEEDSDKEGDETDSEDKSVREENDDELAVATNDVEVVNAAGLTVL
jgi:hypothetical protein